MRYELAPGVRTFRRGRVVIGGSPLRCLRLSERGAASLARLTQGTDVEPRGGEARFASRLIDAGILVPRPGVGAGPYRPEDVTVVIPVRDDAASLDHCLAAIRKHDPGGGLVVVDDGSRQHDRIADIAARYGAQRVRLEENCGPAAARNLGLAMVRTPLVAFVDTDVTVVEDWLPWLLGSFADPEVVLVAPRVVAPPSPDTAVGAYEVARSPLDLGSQPGPVRPRTRISYVPAAAMVARVDALRSVRGFDESLRVGEDVDLCWRLVAAGHRCWYAGDDAVVEHATRSTWRAWAAQRFAYGTSAALLDRRHPGAVAPLGTSPWSVGVWATLAAGHPVVAAALAGGTAVALVRKLSFVGDPAAVTRIGLEGHLRAGEQLARTAIRPWAPLTALAALVSPRVRRTAAIAALGVPLWDWVRRRPSLDPLRWTVASLADDTAYTAGVWWGAWRERSVGALRPEFRHWPGSLGDDRLTD
jgi:mycofactocin system glycosyltransferase